VAREPPDAAGAVAAQAVANRTSQAVTNTNTIRQLLPEIVGHGRPDVVVDRVQQLGPTGQRETEHRETDHQQWEYREDRVLAEARREEIALRLSKRW
jgi:hypothetical protein